MSSPGSNTDPKASNRPSSPGSNKDQKVNNRPGDTSARSMSIASAISGDSGGRLSFPTVNNTTPKKGAGTPTVGTPASSTGRRNSFLGIKRPAEDKNAGPPGPPGVRSRMSQTLEPLSTHPLAAGSPRLTPTSPMAHMDIVRADEVSLATILPPSDGSSSPMLSPRVSRSIPINRSRMSMSPPPARLPRCARSPRSPSQSSISRGGTGESLDVVGARERSPMCAQRRGSTPQYSSAGRGGTPGFFSTAATSGNASSRAPSSSGSPSVGPARLGETIAGRWHVVGSAKKLENDGRIHATIKDRHVTVLWHKGNVHCIDSICAHAGGPLGLGDIEDVASQGGSVVSCIVCPWHSYRVSLNDGSKYVQKIEFDQETKKPKECEAGPGYQAVKGKFQRTHNVRFDGDDVLVELSIIHPNAPFESDRYAKSENKRVGDAAFANVLKGDPSRDLDSKRGVGSLSTAETKPESSQDI